MNKLSDWLPTTKKELEIRGWNEVDVVLFSGDAYVDHPSFGAAVIGRIIEAEGFRVAIVPQPDWRGDYRDFTKLGRPRLFFAISAGSMDSMVNHYTANKRLRSDDAYSPNGQAGLRPDYTTITYAQILKKLYPDVPLVIGGIEASLRRFTHYDYWSDTVKPSILVDTQADLLIYGMGELPLRELLARFKTTPQLPEGGLWKDIPQTAYLTKQTACGLDPQSPNKQLSTCEIAGRACNDKQLFSHEECLKDKRKYAENFKIIEEESNRFVAAVETHCNASLQQQIGNRLVVVNPPYPMMTSTELDASFDLPYTRLPHPKYRGKTIPAYEMIKFSVNLHRGCFGGCAFCTISAHQGKFVVSRSEKSILDEVKKITQQPDFKGYLSDLGGPSANMYQICGKNLELCKKCRKPSCIFPQICKNLNTDHRPLLDIYRKVDALPAIKKSFIGSGVRYDMLLHRSDNEAENRSHTDYTRELIIRHVSGRLKVAPEHTSDKVLNLMRKPSFELFKKFNRQFEQINAAAGLKQQLVPYFISSHPGCTDKDMAQLARETRRLNFRLEQVQDFTPTPMTLATAMYYTGLNPYTLQPVFVARGRQEKLRQKEFFFR
ncbi:MAG: YgiQ family radical SAM protein [Prevotellaceae bacterium]|jgi:uncharacterized radical SAM protein YgiQ|nr:YgiQ family radical SAM protein [Prevotellaceae bacterium]